MYSVFNVKIHYSDGSHSDGYNVIDDDDLAAREKAIKIDRGNWKDALTDKTIKKSDIPTVAFCETTFVCKAA